jgi:hypothetical protein
MKLRYVIILLIVVASISYNIGHSQGVRDLSDAAMESAAALRDSERRSSHLTL